MTIIIVYWLLWILAFIFLLAEKIPNQMIITINLIMVRLLLPFLDFENRKISDNSLVLSLFSIKQIQGIIVIQIFNNQLIERKFTIPAHFVVDILCVYGSAFLTCGNLPFLSVIKENHYRLILQSISIIGIILIVDLTQLCIKFYIFNEIKSKKILQEEVGHVMENLDEVILTKSQRGINYCNVNGVKIL